MRKQAELKTAKPRVSSHPRREIVSREEQLQRFRSIEEWRRGHFEKFKETHPKVHNPH